MPTSIFSDRPRLRLILDHQARIAGYEQRHGYRSSLMRRMVDAGTLPVDREIAAWLAALEAVESLSRPGGLVRR